MKRIVFVIIALIVVSINAKSQNSFFIKEAGMVLTLPNDKWLEETEKKSSKPIYHFKRTDVKTSTGKVIVPEVQIIVEHLKTYVDLTQYSIHKQKSYSGHLKNFKIEKVFTESDGMLKLRYAVGNKASYEDEHGVSHTFYFIHAIKKGIAIQIFIDIPSYLFDHYEEELTSIIKSLEYKQ
jgi:hypothetical protein